MVAYDVSDPKRWRAVHRAALGRGDSLQLSVFLCRLSATELELFVDKLEEIIDSKTDSVVFVDLGPSDRSLKTSIRVIGKPRTGLDPPKSATVL